MVKAFDAREPGHLRSSLLLRESRSWLVWCLVIGQTTCRRSLGILGVGTRMPCPPAVLHLRFRLSSPM